MKAKTKVIIVIAAVVLVIGGVLGAIGNAAGWFVHGAVGVAKQELAPAELLRKYDWLKSAQASLDSKLSTIDAYKGKITGMEDAYKDVPRNQWAMTDATQYNQWLAELDGIKASYNSLAAEYNTRMAEVNWSFCNVGTLPKGRDQVLPREYRNYIDK